MSNDGLYHLQVTYQYDFGIDVYAARTVMDGRVEVNDDDNIYQRDIVVSQEDYGDNDVYSRIVATADGINPAATSPDILCTTAQDGGTLTREFSMMVTSGLDTVEDIDGATDVSGVEYNVAPTGDKDAFHVFLIDGTEFKVTIERVGKKW